MKKTQKIKEMPMHTREEDMNHKKIQRSAGSGCLHKDGMKGRVLGGK